MPMVLKLNNLQRKKMDKIDCNKIMRYMMSCLILTVSFVGCTKNSSIERKLREQIADCKSQSCLIPIAQVTDFKWDKMYVFNHPSAPDVIDHALGIHYPYYVEFTRSIIFLNKNQIVHYENNYSKAEGPTDGEVLFDYPDSLNYYIYKPAQVIFKVKRDTSKNTPYFVVSVK